MPQVGNKKFPYTPSGIKRAEQAYKRQQNPVAATMRRVQNRQRFAGAMNQMMRQANEQARFRAEAGSAGASSAPTRRQQIVGQVSRAPQSAIQDRRYRPERDGPKRMAPVDPGFARRPKPPARPGMRRPMFPPRGPNKNKAWGRNPRPRKPKMIRYL